MLEAKFDEIFPCKINQIFCEIFHWRRDVTQTNAQELRMIYMSADLQKEVAQKRIRKTYSKETSTEWSSGRWKSFIYFSWTYDFT